MNAAENGLADAKIKLAGIVDEEKKIPGVIEEIKAKIEGHQIEYDNCQTEVDRIQKLVDNLRSDDLANQINELEDSIMDKRKTVIAIDSKLASLVEPLENLRVQLRGAEEDLAFLKSQIVICEENLRQAYIKGNDANTLVAHAKQNL